MKLLRNYLFQTLLVVAAVLSMHSCSCGGAKSMEGKLDKVSDKAQVIVALNIEKLFDQLDITVSDKGTIELPSYITKCVNLMGGDKKAVRQLTEFKGIDFTQAVFVGYDLDDQGHYDDDKEKWVNGDSFMMMIFNVSDEDDFVKSVKDADSQAWSGESEGYTVLTTSDGRGPKFLIKDGLAYLVDDDTSVKDLERRLEAAKDVPLASWKKDYLSGDDAELAVLLTGDIFDQMPREFQSSLASSVDIDIMTASMGFKGDLDGPTASLTGALFDKDGNPAKLDFTEKIDTSLLKYVHENDLAVGACGLNSLSRLKTLINRMGVNGMPTELENSMNKILNFKDLTMMFAAGPLNDKSFMDWNNPAEEMRFTMAVSGKPNDMSDLYNFVCEIMDINSNDSTAYYGAPELGKPVSTYPDKYSVRVMTGGRYNWEIDDYEYTYMNFYAQKQGNTIVFSNAPIADKGSNNFTAAEFADKTSMFKFVMPKNLPNLGGIKLPNGFVFSCWGGDTAEGTAQLSITGTEEKIVPALVEMAMSFGGGR